MLCSFWRPHPSTLWIVGKMKCRPPNREASPSFVMSFLSQKENKSNCSMGAWLGRRYQLRTIAILRKLLRGGFGSLKRSEKNHKDPIGTSTKCITMYQDVFDWHHEFGRTMSNLPMTQCSKRRCWFAWWSFSVDLIMLMGLVSAPLFISQVHEAFRDVSININRIPSKNAVSAPLQHETGYAVLCFAEDDWPIQVVEGLVGKCQRIFTAASTLSPSCRMISVFTFTVLYHSINEYLWRFWVTRDWSN